MSSLANPVLPLLVFTSPEIATFAARDFLSVGMRNLKSIQRFNEILNLVALPDSGFVVEAGLASL